MRLPPDFVYMLPPGGIFLLILTLVGAVAYGIHRIFMLKRVQSAAGELSKISTAVGSVSGAIFALSMTFLANAVWNMEDRARETINAEARAISVMDIYLGSLTIPAQDGMARLLADYGTAVAGEWDKMGEDGAGAAAEQALRGIYAAVIDGLSQGDQNRLLQQRLLGALDNLSIARQQRLSIAQDYVSGSQWILVTGLAIVLLVVMAASHADFRTASRVTLAALVVAISIMLFVIILHDRPFIGYNALTPEPIVYATGARS